MQDIRENVINDVVTAMSPVVDNIRLQMLEGAVRGALHGVALSRECTEIATDMDITQHMIDVFAANKRLEGCQEGTLEQYLRTINRFFLTSPHGFQDVTKDDIKFYLAERKEVVAPNTLVNEKRNLSSFFGWLHDEGHIAKNPVKTIKLRGEDVEVSCFSIEEEIAIRDAECSLRDKALIAFLFSTGVRVGEAALMDRSDVDLLKGSVTFRGEKSRQGKYRTVYLDQRARRYLGMYLAERMDENPALFVSYRKFAGNPQRLGRAGIEKVTKTVCERAGVGRKGTVHVFRRTFATRLAEKNCPIEIIQELMGHSEAATTLKCYIAKSNSRTKREWENYVCAV